MDLHLVVNEIYVGYSESKYRLRISLAHPRDCHFVHVQCLPLSIEKPQTPFREIRVMFMFVPVFKTIQGAADCEIRSVICFLNASIVLPSEIHHQICQVYVDNAMSDGMVRKWVWLFNEGRENVHDEARI